MSVEEMADFICDIYAGGHEEIRINGIWILPEDVEEWLESEEEENMLSEICSCGYRFESDETICPNCGKKVEENG